MPEHSQDRSAARRLRLVVPLLAVLAAGCATGSSHAAPAAGTAPSAAAADTSGGSGLDITDPGATPTASPSVSLTDQRYVPGHCYTWDQTLHHTSAAEVPCARTHLFEDLARTDLSREYPPGHPYPTEAGWTTIYDRYCDPLAARFLGYPLDPHGRFTVGAIIPFEDGWATGERTIECGLTAQATVPHPTAFPPFRGKVEGQPQQRVYATGSCLDANQNATSCARRHIGVVAGTVSPAGDNAHPPSRDAASAACSPAVAAFLHRSTVPYASLAGQPTARLAAGWLGGAPESWRAGSHRLTCLVEFWNGKTQVAWAGPPSLG